MHTVIFVEGDRDLKFFAALMSKFKQFAPDLHSSVETVRLRHFLRTDNFTPSKGAKRASISSNARERRT